MHSSKIKLEEGNFLNSKLSLMTDRILESFNNSLGDLNPKYLTYKKLAQIEKYNFSSNLLDFNKNILVFSFGKCAHLMAEGLIEFMGPERNLKVLISSPLISEFNPLHENEYYCFKGGHPYPNRDSQLAGIKALELAHGAGEDDILICLISGGGSAILDCLEDSFDLKEIVEMNSLMLNLGMEDHEINIFRKLTSKIKGGRLAQISNPASILNLIISDDVGNELEAIASGPTVPNSTTVQYINDVISKWKLREVIPPKLFDKIDSKISKKREVCNNRYPNIETNIILDNYKFILDLRDKIKKNNSNSEVFIYKKSLRGNITDCSQKFSDYILNMLGENREKPVLILAGGEIPVKAKKNSKGGRNQHFPLFMLKYLDSIERKWMFCSIATDGCDYVKGIAGSYITSDLKEYIVKKNIDIRPFIKNTNSHSFHQEFGTHLICNKGTGMNVSDVFIFFCF